MSNQQLLEGEEKFKLFFGGSWERVFSFAALSLAEEQFPGG
jgi:hypothetical protein